MEKAMRWLLLALGIGVAAIVLASTTVDEGEVVTLVTKNAAGADYGTQLWIVDVDGKRYLRAGSAHTQWLARLRENAAVIVKRDGKELLFTASPQTDPAVLAEVNRRMAQKYGYADRLWGYVGDRAHAVPILLEPRSGP
jgi:hypothetical protein